MIQYFVNQSKPAGIGAAVAVICVTAGLAFGEPAASGFRGISAAFMSCPAPRSPPSGTIQRALETAARCGVGVRLVLDAREAARLEGTGRLSNLKAVGVLVRASEPGVTMHDKIMIVDRMTVQTGSFNYTVSAERVNIENVIVLWGNIPLAMKFGQHFDEIWRLAADL